MIIFVFEASLLVLHVFQHAHGLPVRLLLPELIDQCLKLHVARARGVQLLTDVFEIILGVEGHAQLNLEVFAELLVRYAYFAVLVTLLICCLVFIEYGAQLLNILHEIS